MSKLLSAQKYSHPIAYVLYVLYRKVHGMWLLDRLLLLSSAAPTELRASAVHGSDMALRRAEAGRMRTPRPESFEPRNPHDSGATNLDLHQCLTSLYEVQYPRSPNWCVVQSQPMTLREETYRYRENGSQGLG